MKKRYVWGLLMILVIVLLVGGFYVLRKNNYPQIVSAQQSGNWVPINLVATSTDSYSITSSPYVESGSVILYQGEQMSNADPSTFSVFRFSDETYSDYAKDKNNVYSYGVVLTACVDEACKQTTPLDPSTFSLVPAGTDTIFSGYMKDKNGVYYQGSGNEVLLLEGADPKTFVSFPVLNQTYGKDATMVWFGDQVVEDALASTFSAEDLYGWDALHVYYMGSVILGADPKTFVPIGADYAKDAVHVYFATSTVTGADPETIQMIDDYSLAKDKNHVYRFGKVIPGANPATFVVPQPG